MKLRKTAICSGASLGVLGGAVLLSFVGFIALANVVMDGATMVWDEAVLRWIHSHATGFYDQFFMIITRTGAEVATVIATVVAILFAYRGWWRRAITIAASVGGAAFINLVLKLLFQRERPDLWLSPVVEVGFSFPSGHAMISSALIFSLMMIAWSTGWRWLAVIGGAILIVLIGLSRLYLGVHYPTDILAGWCVSAGWVAIVTAVVWRLLPPRTPR